MEYALQPTVVESGTRSISDFIKSPPDRTVRMQEERKIRAQERIRQKEELMVDQPRRRAVLEICIQVAGGVPELSKATGLAETNIRSWRKGKHPILDNRMLSLEEYMRAIQ